MRQNITIITIGTKGDVLPFICLARRLHQEGFLPKLAVPEGNENLLRDCDFPTAILPVDVQGFLGMEASKIWLQKGDALAMLNAYQKAEAVFLNSFETALLNLNEKWETDLIIGNFMLNKWLLALAEKSNVPIMVAYAQPLGTKSGSFPHIQISTLKSMPRFFNKGTHFLMEFLRWRRSKTVTNRWRKKLGLKKQTIPFNRLMRQQKITKLYSFSKEIFPHPADWSEFEIITGRWDSERLIPPSEKKPLPDDLKKWLDKGTPPVYLGFGSMPVLTDVFLKKIIALITKKLGLRLLVCTGWSDAFKIEENSDLLFSIPSVAHNLVFPKCLLAIHHGGAGTVHTSLMAGLPSIVCSIISDQHFWGKLIERRKLGKQLYFKNLNFEKLEQSIKMLMEDKSFKNRCQSVGHLLKSEDGCLEVIRSIKKVI